jgi:lipid A 3-O-deacylase
MHQRALTGLALFLSLCSAAHAQDQTTPAAPPPPPSPPPAAVPYEGPTFSLIIENDLFGIDNTDKHYSNGVRLSWLSSATQLHGWLDDAISALTGVDGTRRVGFALGQNIYTPEDKQSTALVENDRPYAGWLYGSIWLQYENARHTQLDTFEIDVGVVGPWAFGEQTQNTFHDIFGVKEANGWDNQLRNEPGIAIIYEKKWRQCVIGDCAGLGVDVIPHVGASLGNVFTYGAVGGMVRFGTDLMGDFGPARIRPALPGSPSFTTSDSFAWYFFAGVEGRGVAHNIFLDGNTFRDSHSVDREPWVADFQAGVALTFSGVRVSYMHVIRTKEFEGQREPDRFGAISVSLRF